MPQREIVRPNSGAPPKVETNGKVPVYRVTLDVRGVGRREVGIEPSSGEPRICYTVPLAGPVDDRWRQAFRILQLDDTGFFRFRLEMASAAITFVCRSSRSAGELEAGIRQLSILVDQVNKAATKMGG